MTGKRRTPAKTAAPKVPQTRAEKQIGRMSTKMLLELQSGFELPPLNNAEKITVLRALVRGMYGYADALESGNEIAERNVLGAVHQAIREYFESVLPLEEE